MYDLHQRSKRVDDYLLTGLSFREYQEYESIAQLQSIELKELLQNYVAIAMDSVGVDALATLLTTHLSS